MIDIGINYLCGYDDIYEYLIKKGFINTIKFPGKACNIEIMNKAFELVKRTRVKIDLHGLPKMITAFNSKDALKNVNWDDIILPKEGINRFSTHMGLNNNDKLSNYTEKELNKNLKDNINMIKLKFSEKLAYPIELGLENIPGGFGFDKETLLPEYIGNAWKSVDFGVFDIAHAKLAAKDLNLLYETYLDKITNKECAKILHISGDTNYIDEYKDKIDKHVMINKYEIKTIINTLKVLKNIDLLVSEYAFNTKYSYQKELLIECITLHTIIKHMDEQKAKQVLILLENELSNTGENIEEVLLKTYI